MSKCYYQLAAGIQKEVNNIYLGVQNTSKQLNFENPLTATDLWKLHTDNENMVSDFGKHIALDGNYDDSLTFNFKLDLDKEILPYFALNFSFENNINPETNTLYGYNNFTIVLQDEDGNYSETLYSFSDAKNSDLMSANGYPKEEGKTSFYLEDFITYGFNPIITITLNKSGNTATPYLSIYGAPAIISKKVKSVYQNIDGIVKQIY